MTDVGLGIRTGGGPYRPDPTTNQPTGGKAPGTNDASSFNPYKASERILSGQELITQMGAPPKFDTAFFGLTVKTNSKAYSGALESLQQYQSDLSLMHGKSLDGAVDSQVIDVLKSHLDEIMRQCDKYETQHSNNTDKSDRRAVMANLKEMAAQEMALLDGISQMAGFEGKGLSFYEGFSLARAGVTDLRTFSHDLNDGVIDKNRSNEKFSSGNINSVALIAYDTEMRVVKPLQKSVEYLNGGEEVGGFDPGDMRIGARNIATANVAGALGLGAMVPMPEIVLHNGDAMLAMKLAPGESVIAEREKPVTEKGSISRYESQLKSYNDHMQAGRPEKAQPFLNELNRMGVRKDDNGVWLRKEVVAKEIPYMASGSVLPEVTGKVQSGLLDLQGLHCLLGQMDGAPKNIFIQINGTQVQVTGIDQDMCLGKELTTLDLPTNSGNQKVDDLRNTFMGPPPLMTREFFDKLKAMTPQSLDKLLGPQISPEEKAAAQTRLTLLQDHGDQLEKQGRVIDADQFQHWTDPTTGETASEFLKNSDQRSYVQRDSAWQATQEKSFLDLRKHHI